MQGEGEADVARDFLFPSTWNRGGFPDSGNGSSHIFRVVNSSSLGVKGKAKDGHIHVSFRANEWLLRARVALVSSLGSHITRKNWPLAPGPRPTSPTLPNLPQSF